MTFTATSSARSSALMMGDSVSEPEVFVEDDVESAGSAVALGRPVELGFFARGVAREDFFATGLARGTDG